MKRSAWIVLATLALVGCESPIIAENRRASKEAYLQIKKMQRLSRQENKKNEKNAKQSQHQNWGCMLLIFDQQRHIA